jgi:hypothetical protein
MAQAPELCGGLIGQGKGVGDLPKWCGIDKGQSSDGRRCSRVMALSQWPAVDVGNFCSMGSGRGGGEVAPNQ